MKRIYSLLMIMAFAFGVILTGCDYTPQEIETASDSGITKTSVEVQTQANGLTVEQENVKNR